MTILLIIFLLSTVINCFKTETCLSRDYGYGSAVCVCNAKFCDTYKSPQQLEKGIYVKVVSDKGGRRFSEINGSFVSVNTNSNATNLITIGTATYQEIIGFGGAFTDSTGINILNLTEDLQKTLLSSYFGDDGLEYSIGRVPIGGSDFSLKGYSYCDTENNEPDMNLTKFKLAEEDKLYKIPIIQQALKLRNNNLDLFASAWIAPGWMKSNPEFTAKQSFLKDEMYQVWADYHLKFLEAYQMNNISFWGITTGNEPLTAFMPKAIPSVAWLPHQMVKWIKENFGPTLRNSNYSYIKIITLDDQRILLPWIVDLLFLDDDVKKYVDGIGLHWYTDFLASPEVLTEIHETFPAKFLIGTEACNGFLLVHVLLGDWDRGELLANYMMEDLNHWVAGWTDWNMALDLTGGPTFIGNNVDAYIIVNSTANEFYKQPSFYVMGHFSKFIPKGSIRIESTGFDKNIPVVAFKRPDNGTIVNILNKETSEVKITLRDSNRGDISIELTPKSITSILYW